MAEETIEKLIARAEKAEKDLEKCIQELAKTQDKLDLAEDKVTQLGRRRMDRMRASRRRQNKGVGILYKKGNGDWDE